MRRLARMQMEVMQMELVHGLKETRRQIEEVKHNLTRQDLTQEEEHSCKCRQACAFATCA